MSKQDAAAVSRRRSHYDALLRAHGVVSENGRPSYYQSFSAMVLGTIYLDLLPVCEGDVITNILTYIGTAGTAGASSPLSKVGLYDSTGARVAVSSDLGTDWQGTGRRVNPLTAPLTVTATQGARGGLYVARLCASWTTAPQLARGANQVAPANAPVSGGMQDYGTGGTAQTDLPSTITVGTAGPLSFWTGAS